jgi:hypothetical protein
MTNTESMENLGLGSRFDEVRKTLLQAQFADRLSKPLEYWVLPSDRRLPLVLLGRTLRDLLSTPFEELSATPGIGEKKINSLVKLLNRATRDEPPTASAGDDLDRATEVRLDKGEFDPSVVSEALWSEWRETVRRSHISELKLGRLAPSLQRLPTVIWHKALGDYLDHTVAEIRSLRTHGEKRVRCVLEVFHSVYNRLLTADGSVELDRWLMPGAVRDVQDWVLRQLESPRVPAEEEVNEQFARPLLGLIATDCGSTVSRLVEERLGINTESRSVREQARQLGVTRARVYQLLDDVGKVMNVRWPEGKSLLDRLTSHYTPLEQQQGQLRLFFGLCELCFPEKQLMPVEAPAKATTALVSQDQAGQSDEPAPVRAEFSDPAHDGQDDVRPARSRTATSAAPLPSTAGRG